jgi:hypothetical protein
MATNAYEELVERCAQAIDMTEMGDGDQLGVALIENFRIDGVCETAAEVRLALDKLLRAAAKAALAEVLLTLETVTSEMEAKGGDVPGTGWPDEPGGFPDVTQVYLAMLRASPPSHPVQS